ncbi:MAG: hypothetical protein IK115_03685 [Lachnospiraceae bacterium]|nr:hypothetical protein [Lachnospiraceae bacterium]
MADKKRKKKKGLVGFTGRLLVELAALAMVLGIFLQGDSVKAVANESLAMRYAVYKAGHNIEDGILFIGTYLIHKDAITDELYEQAQQSASDWGQQDIYYKSELGGGSWFNISEGGSLESITDRGEPVEEEELANLYVQYYMGQDGKLIDVMNGEEKNPFDLVDPYDLTKLPELEPLRLQYTYSEEKTSIKEKEFLTNRNSWDKKAVRADVYYYRIITIFFDMDLRDAETNRCDEDLARLYACYKTLKANENDEEAELVYSLMAKVDARRRAIVFEKLTQGDDNAIGELYELINGKYYTAKGDFKTAYSEGESGGIPEYLLQLRLAVQHDFGSTDNYERKQRDNGNYTDWWIPIVPDSHEDDDEDEEKADPEDAMAVDSDLLSSVSDSLEKCEESYNTHSNNRLIDVDNVLGHAEYEYSMAVIASASAAGLSGDTTNLKNVRNIKEGIISDSTGELDMLNNTLLPKALAKYSGAAQEGTGEDYAKAIANGKGEASKENALNDQKDRLEAKRSELQFLIGEKRKRTEAEVMLADIYQRITDTTNMEDAVPGDAFSARAKQSLEDHIIWLKDEAQSIQNENDSLASDLDKLKAKKEDLQNQKAAALDDNDLSGAADLDAMIAAVDQDIADEEERLKNEMDNADNAGDAAAALVDMGDSMAALEDRLKDRAKSRIDDGDFDGLMNSIDALAAIGAEDALKDLKDDLDGAGAPASVKNALDDAIADAAANANGGMGGDGNSDGKSIANLTEDDLLDAIEALFGDAASLSGDKLAAVVDALSQLSDKGCAAAKRLLKDFLAMALGEGNGFIYAQYSGNVSVEYVLVTSLAYVSGYRYVYDDAKQQAKLTRGADVYEFTAGNPEGGHGGGTINLKTKPVLSGGFYLGEDDVKDNFKCWAQYLNGTDYAVCISEDIEDMASELLAMFGE